MNLYKVNIEDSNATKPHPVVLIKAETITKANKIAEETITYTGAFTVEKIDMRKSGVLILSGSTN